MLNSRQDLDRFLKVVIDTSLNLITTEHPEIDSQTVRVNQLIKGFLRSYFGREPRKWMAYLHLVEFAYDASYHHEDEPTQGFLRPRLPHSVTRSNPMIKVEVDAG